MKRDDEPASERISIVSVAVCVAILAWAILKQYFALG
jgi:hypothetical protein